MQKDLNWRLGHAFGLIVSAIRELDLVARPRAIELVEQLASQIDSGLIIAPPSAMPPAEDEPVDAPLPPPIARFLESL